jgi:hypothetical protein
MDALFGGLRHLVREPQEADQVRENQIRSRPRTIEFAAKAINYIFISVSN